jgi:NADPH2:quinone reductase
MFSWQVAENLGIEGLVQVDIPIPLPKPGELLVKVEVAALNYSDLLMINDTYQIKPPKPFTPGQEIAGKVVKVGEGVMFDVGQRVASKVLFGGFAEYAIVRADMVIVVPETIALSSAVTLPVSYTTAMVAFTKVLKVHNNDYVLIHSAAGGLGLAAVQIARYLGVRVLATAGTDDKCRVAKENGAEMAINYLKQNWYHTILEATENKGVDVIFDSVGGKVTQESLKCLAWQGRLLIVGFSSGDLPYIPAHRLLLKNASAIGVYWSHDHNQEMLSSIGKNLVQLCVSGDIQPIIWNYYSFKDLPQALSDLRDRNSFGKLLMKFSEEGAIE